MNLNKVFIIGNLTRDPELRAIPSGVSVATIGVATNRIWKSPSGEKKSDVQFHNVVVFGKQAEIVNQYLNKGSMVMIEGRLQTRMWDAQDGTKRSRTEIIAERIQFGPKNSQGSPRESSFEKSAEPVKNELPEIDINEEEIGSAEDLPF
jgi:single-strand DNA-binding protein